MNSQEKAQTWTSRKATAKAQTLVVVAENKERFKRGDEGFLKRILSWEKTRLSSSNVCSFHKVVKSSIFENFVMFIILANSITIAIETDWAYNGNASRNAQLFTLLDTIYLSVYLTEFMVKVYVLPISYWRDNYNLFDFIVLVISSAQWVSEVSDSTGSAIDVIKALRALRALRAFRAISFIKSLQVLVTALVITIRKNALDILILLFLIMFIFGVLGHYLFGVDGSAETKNDWGTLGDAIMTLWIYVCADGWVPYQDNLTSAGYQGSEVFTAVFIFIGNFVVSNLFIGVICQNINEASEADKEYKMKLREVTKIAKRDIFLQKQRQDLSQLVAQKSESSDLQTLLQELAGRLRHEDLLPMNHLSCDPVWFETFMTTLNYHENTLYRIQQAQLDVAYTLSEIADRKVPGKIVNET